MRRRSAVAGARLLLALAGIGLVLVVTAPALPSVPAAPAKLPAWADVHGPATAAAALGHLAARIALVPLAALGVLHLGAAAAPRGALPVAARRMTPTLLRVVLGLAVAGAAVGPYLAASAAARTDRTDAPTGPEAATATVTHLAGSRDRSGPTDAVGPADPAPAEEVTAATAEDQPQTWTVSPGDHFWRIAAETLADHLGRRPDDAEIDPYWRRLVDANRDRLVVPGNADLVLPGQVLTLPRVAAAPVGAADISSGTPAGS